MAPYVAWRSVTLDDVARSGAVDPAVAWWKTGDEKLLPCIHLLNIPNYTSVKSLHSHEGVLAYMSPAVSINFD